MSAETLRKAASLMRERAKACAVNEWYTSSDAFGILRRAEPHNSAQQSDAEHIASWHPAVALAVADWLEWTALTAEFGVEPPVLALAVARAYLGDRDA